MGLNPRGRGRGGKGRRGMPGGPGPMFRGPPGMCGPPPMGFPPGPPPFGPPCFGGPCGSNFGPRRPPGYGKFPRKNFKGRPQQKNSNSQDGGMDLTKPWVTDEIRTEEGKKQECLETWRKTKDDTDWSKYKEQKQLVLNLYNKAKTEYMASKPNEGPSWFVVTSFTENVYCDACDRSFPDERGLYLHQSEHETCGRDGCTYSAHAKLVAKHVKMQHDTGLYKRIGRLNTEEDIAKWVEERKRKYPTRKVVEEKKAVEEEKVKRGERIKEDDGRFNKSFSKRERRKVKTFKNKVRKSHVERKEVGPTVEEALKEESSWRGTIPPFDGIGTSNEETLEEETKHVDNFSDDEWEAITEVKKEKTVSNSLGLLATCYDSNVSDDEPPEEVKTVRVKEDCPAVEEETRPQQEKRRRGRSKRCKTDDKEGVGQCDTRKRKRELTLLEKLLSKEIRHERNVILQCVRSVKDTIMSTRACGRRRRRQSDPVEVERENLTNESGEVQENEVRGTVHEESNGTMQGRREINPTIQAGGMIQADVLVNMLQQNQLLLQSVLNQNAERQRSFQVTPDLYRSVNYFYGDGGSFQAELWLKELEGMARLNSWPDDLLLETARQRMKGAARHWLASRVNEMTSWHEFVQRFKRTFTDRGDVVTRWNQMQSRLQRANESVYEYLFEKERLCREVGLNFDETKERILTGLKSKDLCDRLLTMQHHDMDELVKDVEKSLRIANERRKLHSGLKTTEGNFEKGNVAPIKFVESVKTEQEPVSSAGTVEKRTDQKTSNNDKKRPVKKENGEPKCYNCNDWGHIARDCPQERRTLKCRKCEGEGHTQRHCVMVLAEEQGGAHAMKYEKEIVINGKILVAQIDCGSAVCAIKASAVISAKLRVINTNESMFCVFGSAGKPTVKSLGETVADIKVDDARPVKTTLVIVPDEAQNTDILLGRTYLDQPSVAWVKLGNKLYVGDADEFPFSQLDLPSVTPRVRVKSSRRQELQANTIGWVEVETQFPVTGNYALTRRGCEESPLILNVENGKAKVSVFTATDTVIPKGQSWGRAKEVRVDKSVSTREDEEGENEVKSIEEGHVRVETDTRGVDKTELVELLNEFRDCVALETKELGCTNVLKMDIVEEPGSKPVQRKPYHVNREDRETIKKIVSDWKKMGIVTETKSPYASPVLLVKKKTGEKRLVVDYRALNNQTVKLPYPMPNIDDILEGLANYRYFTTLDLAHGYLQVPLTEEAQEKTAFITPDDTGQLTRMMFGLTNGPAVFVKLMNEVLGPLRNTIVMSYLDDLLIPSNDWNELRERLRLVLEALRKAGLTLRLEKCYFARHEVEFLGFRVSSEGLKPGLRKVEAIKQYKRPKNVHEVRRFLGLTGFFRRFIERYSMKAEPLTKLTKQNEPFVWDEGQELSFQELKAELISEPVLRLYDPNAPTELHTDASSVGLAGILLQADDCGRQHLVYCVSKRLTETESRYHSTKLELMALIWSMNRLRQFLLPIEFTAVTDCQAICFMNMRKTKDPQIARWCNLIQDFNVNVRHRSGKAMAHVDALSRAPHQEASDTVDTLCENQGVFAVDEVVDPIIMWQRGDGVMRKRLEILGRPQESLSAEEKNYVKDYVIDRGRLCRLYKGRKLIVVPDAVRKWMTIKYHDDSGHYAVDKVMYKILQNYYFSDMRNYIKQHIRMCLRCILAKQPGGKRAGLLHPIPPGRRPFEIVHLDHLGPFPKTPRQNKYVLLAICNLTKFTQLFAVRDTSTGSIIKCFQELIRERGAPKRIITDRGSGFTSKTFEEFCLSFNIKHTLNSSRHPRANGQVERINRTLTPIMSMSTNTRKNDWDKQIPTCQQHLNSSMNNTIGKTPFYALYGYEPHFHDAVLMNSLDREEEYKDPSIVQTEIINQIENKQKELKSRFDRKAHPGLELKVGDIVFMERAPEHTGQPVKLQNKYRGPLVVNKVLPSDTYQVVDLDVHEAPGRLYATTAHISQLKPWQLRHIE